MTLQERVQASLDLLARAGSMDYVGEPVSQLEHGLQAAHAAAESGAPAEEILAALFHDLGHSCAPAGSPQMEGLGVLQHESIGADRLSALGFPESVTELVRGHVQAKRYLVTRTAGYLDRLTPASRRTLDFQGGPMSAQEARDFEQDPAFKKKLRVRHWDEQAKDPGRKVPGLDAYRPLIQAALGGTPPDPGLAP